MFNEVKWAPFKIEDVFEIKPGKRLTKADMNNGKTPFIGATDSNNGITEYVSNTNQSADSNIIGVNYNGSVGEAFYHPYNCIFSDDVKRLKLKNGPENKYVYLFITEIVKHQCDKYTYGYKFNENRMRRQSIVLPVDSNGNPDYAFMEEYMRSLDVTLRDRYLKYIQKLETANGGGLTNCKLDSFTIGSLFRLEHGLSKGLNHLDYCDSGVNYLSATNLNNGVSTQVKRIEKLIQPGNCIAFIRNGEGSMGYSIYKHEEIIATSDISLGYNDNLNKYVGMFITTVADKVRGKYNFGYKRNDARLSAETLILPVDHNCQPDWRYMDNYMRLVEAKQLYEYVQFIES